MRPTSETFSVLLVEDDDKIARLTVRYLEQHGLAVTLAGDGREGLAKALSGGHDVVVLDLMLPGMPGLEVCRAVRARSTVPILVLTALGEEPDRVIGLEAGADDYLAKPFSSRELLARLRALVRRSKGRLGPEADVIRVGPLALYPHDYAARLDGRPLRLTTAEFVLLRAFAERAGRVLTRDQLLEATRSDAGEVFDRAIDAHISRLRQKLGDDPRQPRLLRTIRGAGYLLATDPDRD